MATAQAADVPVEDVSQRTESERVFAQPDGSWMSETSISPEQVRDADGLWKPIDTTLVAVDGGFAPKAALAHLKVSDGGDTSMASMSVHGKDIGWSWPTTLPAPVVAGSTATYRNVMPGGDLVVTATATGFSHDLVLRERPTEPLRVTTPVATEKSSLSERADGSLSITDGSGASVVAAPAPLMWDAGTDASGQPDNAMTIDTTVTPTSEGATVTLKPDQGFLADPDTQYPVTIDPSYYSGDQATGGDVWVGTDDKAAHHNVADTLLVGTDDGGTTKYRSYLRFPTGKWSGAVITDAWMGLRNSYSKTCSGTGIQVARVTESWAPSTTTFNNQPAVTGTNSVSVSTALGASSSCPAGAVTFPLTAMVRDWASGVANYGVRLMGVNETTSNSSYREYRSMEYTAAGGDTSLRPRLNVYYNHKPATASTPVVGPGNTGYSTSKTPTLTSVVSDPDGGTLTARFAVSGAVPSTVSGSASSGGTAQATSPALAEGSHTVTATATDGTLDAASVSATTTFVVDTVKPEMTVSATGVTKGGWTNAPPAANTMTLTTTSADIKSLVYSLDGGASTTVAMAGPGTHAFAWLPPNGSHTLRAYPVDKAGNAGTTSVFSFGYGSLYMTAPTAEPVTKTSGTVGIDAAGPAGDGPGGAALTRNDIELQWRVAGSTIDDASGWNKADISGLNIVGNASTPVHLSGVWDTTKAKTDATFDPDGPDGPLPMTSRPLDDRVPVMLDLRLCVNYSAGMQCTWSNNPAARRQVLRVPHAFGAGFPVTDIEGGQVAQWTGEFAASATDATLNAGSTTLSISRTHTSYAGPGLSAASRVFGSGWVASLDGPQAGLASEQLIDDTTIDGTLKVVDPAGAVIVLAPEAAFDEGMDRRTTDALAPGTWYPVDDAGQESGLTAQVTGQGGTTQVKLIEIDGTTTTFKATTAPTGLPNATQATAAILGPDSVQQPGEPGKTSYGYDAANRVRWILASTSGVTCSAPVTASDTITALPAGCRALLVTYAPAGAVPSDASPGPFAGEVQKITALVGSGTGATAATRSSDVAAYAYDSNGRLRSVTDPRNSLTTRYTWDGTAGTGWSGAGQTGTYTPPRIASMTPAGLETINYAYTTGDAKLSTLTRARTAGDPAKAADPTARLATIIYDVPVNQSKAAAANGTDLPNLTGATVNAWGVAGSMPLATSATAVFGLDHKPAGTTPETVTAGDWRHADLSYVDDRGYEVYTASYGAGAWQYTATQYDTHSNIVRNLSESDIAAIGSGQLTPAQAGTLTIYNREVTGSATETNPTGVQLPEGTVVTDGYATARLVTFPDGHQATARPHTHTIYDEGAPHDKIDPAKGQAYALPTTTTVSLADASYSGFGDLGDIHADTGPSGAGEPVLSQTLTDYDDAVPTTVAGINTGLTAATGTNAETGATTPGSCGLVDCAEAGWALGLASSSTIVMGASPDPAADLVTRTAYDPTGRLVATSNPKAVAAAPGTPAPANVGTRETVYYTTAANPRAAVCGNKPEYDGRVCLTRYAGAPSQGPALVTSKIDAYNDGGQPLTVIETSGTAARTTTSEYRADGQPTKTTTTASGLTGSTAVPTVTYAYHPTTGLPTSTTPSTGDAITQSYDTWGRQVAYQTSSNGGAGGVPETTTTAYDEAGRVRTVTDRSLTGGASTTYSYDTTETGGAEEHRGLVTKLTVDNPGGRNVTITGAYDAAGRLTRQNLPGNLVEATSFDTAGQVTGKTYRIGGSSTPLLGWSQAFDGLGRIIGETTPEAGALGTGPTGTGALRDGGYLKAYRYDRAGRLTRVADHASLTAGINGCVIREYGFDGGGIGNGNRTSLTTTPSATDGTCQTSSPTGATTKTLAYDTADRLTGTTAAPYAYDTFGRVTTMPESDIPMGRKGGTAGNLGLGYYDTDAARFITQGDTSTVFELDAASRRTTSTTTVGTGPAITSTSVVRHYTDGSDNPGWTTTTRNGASTTERYANAIDGNLAATLHTGGSDAGVVQLTLSSPHGDTPTQITLPGSGDAVAIDGWQSTDEYGNPLDPVQTGRTVANNAATTGPAPASNADGLGYGWLGAKERATDPSGLLLMGARLYDPITASFTSSDPVYGGNPTAYGYPSDPINSSDLNGKWCVAGIGTTCIRWVATPFGGTVAVRAGIRKKITGDGKGQHRISWSTVKYVIGNMYWDHNVTMDDGSVRGIYYTDLAHLMCEDDVCTPTGETVKVRTVIDWGPSKHPKDGKMFGVVSMYCKGYGKCPRWVNDKKKRR